jgi:hypothetical protein
MSKFKFLSKDRKIDTVKANETVNKVKVEKEIKESKQEVVVNTEKRKAGRPKSIKTEIISKPTTSKKEVLKTSKNEYNGEIKPFDPLKMKRINLNESKYYQEVTPKSIIVLHHTESREDLRTDLETFANDPLRITPNIIILRDGTAHQLFSSSYWSHHIGLDKRTIKELGFEDFNSRNDTLEKSSISIELDNLGNLLKLDTNRYRTVHGGTHTIDDSLVTEYNKPFKGCTHFESYTDEQLNTLGELLVYFNQELDIKIKYKEDMFNFNLDALKGKKGLWSHGSFIESKSDCHPDTKLIELLKKINIK